MARTALSCEQARVELSARLDGESDPSLAAALDDHVATCSDCRAHEAALMAVRRSLRAQPAEAVPDLTRSILERTGAQRRARRERRVRIRIAAVAAATTALVLIGALLVWGPRPADTAGAAEITRQVRAAARSLHSYTATYQMTERGWNPQIPVRRFTAHVFYDASERFRLTVRDQTVYPGPHAWPENNVDLIAAPGRWWIREPTACPAPALPQCPVPEGTEERTVVHRQPFDGTTALPTDVIVPLETLAGSTGFRVLGEERVLDRDAYVISLPYRQAAPLIGALEAGGDWRTFRPSQRVRLWIDTSTWFPLRFAVAGDHGESALDVRATDFSTPSSLRRRLFQPPRSGLVKDGGFNPTRVPQSMAPDYRAGLAPYRSGVTDQGQHVLSYSRGMTWLKIVMSPSTRRFPAFTAAIESVRLRAGSIGYYQPAAVGTQQEARRQLDLYGRSQNAHIESNLPRAQLMRVAASLSVGGRAIPQGAYRRGSYRLRRLDQPQAARLGFARLPSYLPRGYRFSVALLSHGAGGGQTLRTYFHQSETEYDSSGILITASPTIRYLPPSSQNAREVAVRGHLARWSPTRGELEWIDDGVYRAVSAPAFGLHELLRIAASLQ